MALQARALRSMISNYFGMYYGMPGGANPLQKVAPWTAIVLFRTTYSGANTNSDWRKNTGILSASFNHVVRE